MLSRIAAASLLFCAATARAEEAALPISEALAKHLVRADFMGNGRESATLHLANTGTAALKLRIPVGTLLVAENGEKQISLRTLTADVEGKGEADAILPTAALSSKNTPAQRTLTMAPTADPRVAKLLEFFDKQNDLPRPTAQLAIFISLEDLAWPAWQQWLAPVWSAEKPTKQHPTPAEIAQAVDAAAFIRLTEPEKKPALLADENFKRLALRNPWARPKAMALYGLTVDDAVTGDPSLPPDLGKLLHTSPNDNCPICRQRAQMQKGTDF